MHDYLIEINRIKYGLPKHFKCSCKDCAKWRELNHSKISDLDWDMKFPLPVEQFSVPVPTRPQSQPLYQIAKDVYTTTAPKNKMELSTALQTALEAGGYVSNNYNDPKRKAIDDALRNGLIDQTTYERITRAKS